MFLEHVNLSVSDLGRSIGFYCGLLGLEVRWQGTTSDGSPAAHVGDERCYLALFQAAGPEPTEADYTRVGLNHFGFVVQDLDQVHARLTAQGITPHHQADYEPGRRLYFFDPDGIEVEVVEYAETPVTPAAPTG